MWLRSRRVAASSSRSTWGSDHDAYQTGQRGAAADGCSVRAPATTTSRTPTVLMSSGRIPSAAQVGAAVNGILIATRQDVADWALDGAIFGREAYRIDPRRSPLRAGDDAGATRPRQPRLRRRPLAGAVLGHPERERPPCRHRHGQRAHRRAAERGERICPYAPGVQLHRLS